MIDHTKPIAVYEPNFKFTSEQLTEMCEMQNLANSNMFGPDWMQKSIADLPYYRATLVESVEAIQEMGYKWWKKETCDTHALRMELVDILHFVLSDVIRNNQGIPNFNENKEEDSIIFAIGRFATIQNFSGDGFRFSLENPRISIMTDINAMTFNDLCEQMIFNCLIDGIGNLNNMILLFESVGMSPIEVYSQYIAKNVLNMFRDANGQKEGSYYRVWNGNDDNEVLSAFISSCRQKGINVNKQSINEHLTQQYATSKLTHK